jgi:hypothetical protein
MTFRVLHVAHPDDRRSLVKKKISEKHVPSKENVLAISTIRSDIAHQYLDRTHPVDIASSIFSCLFDAGRRLRIRAHATS